MRIVFGRIGGLVLGLMLLAGIISPATGADSRVSYSNGRSNGYSNGQQYSYHAHHRHHRYLHWRWRPHAWWHQRH